MKKLFCVIFSFILLLCGCGDIDTVAIPQVFSSAEEIWAVDASECVPQDASEVEPSEQYWTLEDYHNAADAVVLVQPTSVDSQQATVTIVDRLDSGLRTRSELTILVSPDDLPLLTTNRYLLFLVEEGDSYGILGRFVEHSGYLFHQAFSSVKLKPRRTQQVLDDIYPSEVVCGEPPYRLDFNDPDQFRDYLALESLPAEEFAALEEEDSNVSQSQNKGNYDRFLSTIRPMLFPTVLADPTMEITVDDPGPRPEFYIGPAASNDLWWRIHLKWLWNGELTDDVQTYGRRLDWDGPECWEYTDVLAEPLSEQSFYLSFGDYGFHIYIYGGTREAALTFLENLEFRPLEELFA